MQVKTWFQNRRMKYKRQSEEVDMEMKSPKYSYGSFMYGGMSPLYGYMPMQYKPENGLHYGYTSNMRTPPSPAITGMDGSFQSMPLSSPTVVSSFSSPFSMSPRNPQSIRTTTQTSAYLGTNGMFSPTAASSYSPQYYGNEIASNQLHYSDWHRSIPAPPPTP